MASNDGASLKRGWGLADSEDGALTALKRPRTEYFDDRDQGPRRRLAPEEYNVAWICALPIELAAARAMLDEIHEGSDGDLHDSNCYTLGNIGMHNIIIACLPAGQYGTNNAAIVASHLKRSFPETKIHLMVGIGGGVPKTVDVRLGDVVVGDRVIQYDYGKTTQQGHFHRTSDAVKPPQNLMTAVAKLRAVHELEFTKISAILTQMLRNHPRMTEYADASSLKDWLFESNYDHDKSNDNCEYCDKSKLITTRHRRTDKHPHIHYGVIASANQVMKHAGTRDSWATTDNVLCFEMEAAGLMDHFQCLVIRGICDYSDSHKAKQWQRYSAAVAAAYAKELLDIMPLRRTQTILVDRAGVAEAPSPESPAPPLQSLPETQKKALLESLKFEQIDARLLTIKNSHQKTCKWLLTKTQYMDWLDPEKLDQHHGFLWIKGKPGAGKSTLMKYIFRNAQKAMRCKVIISFFFNARGSELEKSTIGMYRSLLVQLLEKIPTLQCVFEFLGLKAHSLDQSQYWTVEILKDLFEQAIGLLGNSSVACFIDALDECDQNEVRDMVALFERLGNLAVSDGLGFCVCFSSRHYPHITLESGLELTLEGQEGHEKDISSYIQTELKIGDSKLADAIRTEVQEKASGVFMWVVLVVDILNAEYDNGRMHALQKRLREIPGDLHELFRDILSRDQYRQNELLLCIQWVLFARTPLKPQELYFAILLGGDDEIPNQWDQEEISEDDIQRFILSSSKGLTEVTKSKPKTVQFIHESVRDFLLKDEGLRKIWPNLEKLEGQSHETLKNCCEKYISLDISTAIDSNSSLDKPTADLRRAITTQFPFLQYAVQNILHHTDEAESFGASQRDFIDDLQLNRWIHLHNVFERFDNRRYENDTRFLYILAEANAAHLIKICPFVQGCTEIRKERYGCPLLAAMATGSYEAVQTFRTALARNLPLLLLEPQGQQLDPTDLIERRKPKLSRNFTYSSNRSLLSYVAEYGDEDLFITVMMNDGSNERKDGKGRTSLMWAAEYGYNQAISLLIGTEKVYPNQKDKSHQTPLLLAAKNGHEQAIKLLLGTGRVNPTERDKGGQTPLSWAARNGHDQVIRLLLEIGCMDLDERDNKNLTPLLWAARNGHDQVIRLLLEIGGINPHERYDENRTALSHAAEKGSNSVIELLLKTEGADPTIRDKNGRTALSWAASSNCIETITLLLNTGRFNVNEEDDKGRTIFSHAAGEGCNSVIEMLFKTKGVDPTIRDKNGRTALSWAASNNCIETITLLLDTGRFNVNEEDDEGRTSLSHAAGEGCNSAIERLLRTEGIDLEKKDNQGRTPLSYAAASFRTGSHGTRLLLEIGKADPELKDNNGRTPLSHAAETGFSLSINQLEEIGRADPNKRDNNGRTALFYAAQQPHSFRMEAILKIDMVDLDVRDNNGRTAMSYAVERNDGIIVKLLKNASKLRTS